MFSPAEIGVRAPEGAELETRRTESTVSDGVLTSHEALVGGGGLNASVILFGDLDESDADKLARQRSVAEFAIQQWRVATDSLHG